VADELGIKPCRLFIDKCAIMTYFTSQSKEGTYSSLSPRIVLKDRRCPFLQDNRCTIYNNRPFICRLFPYRALSALESIRAISAEEEKEELGRFKRSCSGLKRSHQITPDEEKNYLKDKESIQKEMFYTLDLFKRYVDISQLSSSDIERLSFQIDNDDLGTGIHSIFVGWEEKIANILENDEGLGQLLETDKQLLGVLCRCELYDRKTANPMFARLTEGQNIQRGDIS